MSGLPRRAALALPLLPLPATAQEARAQRLLVGFPPGGGLDLLARLLAERAAALGGRPVVVENRAGAGGLVAAEALAQAPGDGGVLMLAPIVVSAFFPFLHRRLSFDPLRDLAPVAMVTSFNFALVVRADHPARDVAGFVTWARAQGDRANYGSISPGTPSHFLGLLFNREAGTALTHVPYRGSAPLQQALLAGEVQASFDTTASVLGQLRAGTMRALAVTGSARSPVLPEVPAFAEAGGALAGLGDAEFWYGLYAPGRTPAALRESLAAPWLAALAESATAQRLAAMDLTPRPMGPEAFAARIAADAARWEPVIRASGFTLGE